MTSSAGVTPDRRTVRDRARPGTAPPRPTDEDSGALIAPALARAIVAVVFCGFGGIALLLVIEEGKSADIVLALALLAGVLGLQYFYFGRPSTDLRSRGAYAALAAQAILVYVPLAFFGESWVGQSAFLMGSVLLVLPLPVAWPVYVAIVASAGVAQYVVSGGVWFEVAYLMVNTATAGLFVYGLTRLARIVTALHEARDELAKSAVAHERLRFARDLHDLLGLSLSAIAPKGELALRLIRKNPGEAERELSEILEISRRALSDVRAIARLYREIATNEETTTLASMLAASNVDLRVDLDLRELPPHMRTALSALLREGVEYVLRHRKVEQCEVAVRQEGGSVSVDIVNDDPGAAPTAEAGGVDNLQTMVSRMGGEMSVVAEQDGRLRLHIDVPVTARSPEHRVEAAAEPAESIPLFATKFANWLVVAVFFGNYLQAVLRGSWVTTGFWEMALVTGYMTAALVLQLAYFSRPGVRLRSSASYLLLALMAAVVFVPALQFQSVAWVGLQGLLAGSALLVLRPALGWSVFAAVIAAVAWLQSPFIDNFVRAIALPIVTVDLALVAYGVTWMARTIRQLRETRQELAEVALAETRLRFARDLHDLLGLSLSAITLKSELAYRLILLDPERARTELTEVLEISRHALADVRSVASGYHEMSLAEECQTAESLLTTAGLDVRMDIDYADLPAEVSTVLATVLREGVTNVLRHSKGECCEITIRTEGGEAFLHVVNDGVTKQTDRDRNGWGSGIRNMSDRVANLGGVLTAQYEGDGRFGLAARIPVPRS
jgi:signal transduction histidine kinase